MRGVSFEFDGLRLRGASRAGRETWFRVDPPGLALDVGRGAETLVGVRWIFLSHGHLDHALGLPWLLSQRNLQGLRPPRVFCPASVAAELRSYVRAASGLEGQALDFELVGLEPGDSRPLGPELRLEVFEPDHVVRSLGCHLFRTVERLRPRYAGLAPPEVAELKRAGETIVERHEEIRLTYCGDTGPAIFERDPRLFDAEILLVECTFWGEETRHLGARFGHLHLSDFVDNADRFQNKTIVLCHLSRRHRAAQFEQAVRRALPDLSSRIRFIGG